jgi:hypothetical protein
MDRKHALGALVAAALAAAAAGPAAAAVETFSIGVDHDVGAFTFDYYTLGVGSAVFDDQIAQFDPSLGTLNSVTVTLTATALLTGYVSYYDPHAAFGEGTQAIGNALFTAPGVSFLLAPQLVASVLCFPHPTFPFGGSCSAASPDQTEAYGGTSVITDLTRLQYVGAGSVDFLDTLNTTARIVYQPTAGAVANAGSQFLVEGSTLTVSYDYTAPGAPEPGVWALMIAGFGLAGATLRRRAPRLGAFR